MEEVTDRRDALTAQDLRRRRPLGTQPDPSPGELAIDRAHGAVERQASRSGFGRPEVFHVVGSTTRCVTFQRLSLPHRRLGFCSLPHVARMAARSLRGLACRPARRRCGVHLVDHHQVLDGLHGEPSAVNLGASRCDLAAKEPAPRVGEPDLRRPVRLIGAEILDECDSARAFMREYGWTSSTLNDPGPRLATATVCSASPSRRSTMRREPWPMHCDGPLSPKCAPWQPRHDPGP